MSKFTYINNTGVDVTPFHGAIMEAIGRGGVFGEDLSDVFALCCPAGEWLLGWA